MKLNEINITFKNGMYPLNAHPNFNYQLNRLVTWDGGRLEDVQKVGATIKDSAGWKETLTALGKKAENEGRTENAIAYYRMSEFFMYEGDPDKLKAYKKAVKIFREYHAAYFSDGLIEEYQVPYQNGKLPVWKVSAQGECKDIILLHGGYDSYMEELLYLMLYLAKAGFDIYLFEGPGQGGVLRLQEMPFLFQWEKPVSAILDYFNLNEVTIIGASLGGYLAPRAAAFEKRIKRVIAWSVLPDFFDVVIGSQPKNSQKILKFLLKHHAKAIVNFIFKQKIKHGDEMVTWGLKHGMYAFSAKTPYDFLQKLREYSLYTIGDKITQDVLIIGASQDHFADYRNIGKEICSMPNVHSLTFRLMTAAESASNHCNCGNSKLTLDIIIDWICASLNEK